MGARLGLQRRPFAVNPDRRAVQRAELDAYYATLWGLTTDERCYILDPADVMGEDCPPKTFRVLKSKGLRVFGELPTQRLVLKVWDKLETGELHRC